MPAPDRPIRTETKTAFYKAVKFWLALVLALLAAAALWRLIGAGQGTPATDPAAGAVSYIR